MANLSLHAHSVYLAGPDVFRLDAAERFRELAAECEARGMEALIPAEGLVTAGLARSDVPRAIFEANMALLRRSHGLIANLAPFRGSEPDSGTVFEVGVAVALGLPVVGYGLPRGEYAARVPGAQRDSAGVLRDAAGLEIEEFGLPANLMLARAIRFERTAADAIATLAVILKRRV
jgi:nucleoside 2-deoxyribosyltransferase